MVKLPLSDLIGIKKNEIWANAGQTMNWPIWSAHLGLGYYLRGTGIQLKKLADFVHGSVTN